MYRLMDTEAKVRLLTISQETEIERLSAELQSLNCLKEQNIQLDSEVMSRDITISELETCLKQLESEIADLRSQLQAKVNRHLSFLWLTAWDRARPAALSQRPPRHRRPRKTGRRRGGEGNASVCARLRCLLDSASWKRLLKSFK